MAYTKQEREFISLVNWLNCTDLSKSQLQNPEFIARMKGERIRQLNVYVNQSHPTAPRNVR